MRRICGSVLECLMQTNSPTALERAFELAKSGEYTSIVEIRSKLKSEGLGTEQITGPSLLRQLRQLIAANAAANTGG